MNNILCTVCIIYVLHTFICTRNWFVNSSFSAANFWFLFSKSLICDGRSKHSAFLSSESNFGPRALFPAPWSISWLYSRLVSTGLAASPKRVFSDKCFTPVPEEELVLSLAGGLNDSERRSDFSLADLFGSGPRDVSTRELALSGRLAACECRICPELDTFKSSLLPFSLSWPLFMPSTSVIVHSNIKILALCTVNYKRE